MAKKTRTVHRHHSLHCADVFSHICENLDADLDSPQCREIKRHIAGCPDCTALLDSLKKTVYLYRTVPIPTIPASSRRKLYSVLSLETGRRLK
ncbi:MAG: zf-HC2 domain-containing protein [Bacteroidota bacterium]|nr:zf-HC2 domain-containing protein [Bacteroidota bacterium]